MGPRKSCLNLYLHAVAEGIEEPNEEDIEGSSPGSRLRGAIGSAAHECEDEVNVGIGSVAGDCEDVVDVAIGPTAGWSLTVGGVSMTNSSEMLRKKQ